MDVINLNQNTVNCVHVVEDIGSRRIYNICTDTIQYVPWGVWDTIGNVFGALGATLFIAGLLFISYVMLFGD